MNPTVNAAINFEIAISILGSLIGLKSIELRKEEQSSNSNNHKLRELKSDLAKLWLERHNLRPSHQNKIQIILSIYGQTVRTALSTMKRSSIYSI